MTIKQFHASHLINDDRLLFQISTVDNAQYRFLLTRRVTLFILAATQHLITKELEATHTPTAAKALVDFEQEAVKAGQTNDDGKLKEVPVQPANVFPIGVDPVLIMDVNCSLEKVGLEEALLMNLILPGGGNLNLKMAGQTLHAMCALLNQLREHASWGDVPQIINTAPDADEKKPSDAEKNKPKLH